MVWIACRVKPIFRCVKLLAKDFRAANNVMKAKAQIARAKDVEAYDKVYNLPLDDNEIMMTPPLGLR